MNEEKFEKGKGLIGQLHNLDLKNLDDSEEADSLREELYDLWKTLGQDAQNTLQHYSHNLIGSKEEIGEGMKKIPIVVDLDGVLSEYSEWKGIDHYGPVPEGAIEFLQELKKFAKVTLCTCRLNPELNPAIPMESLIFKVTEFLAENKIPYDNLFVGRGKPHGFFYIDDRAVVCRPQHNVNAFEEALKEIKWRLERQKEGNV